MNDRSLLDDHFLRSGFVEDWAAQVNPHLPDSKPVQALLNLRVYSYLPLFALAADGRVELRFPAGRVDLVSPSAGSVGRFVRIGEQGQTQFEIPASQMPRLLEYADLVTSVARTNGGPYAKGVDVALAVLMQDLLRVHLEQKYQPYLDPAAGQLASGSGSEAPLVFSVLAREWGDEESD